MNVDKDEQLRRFNERENTPEKRWKITDEDWRNREKWDTYEKYVDRMITLTSTDIAPWTILEGNDKKYARIKALKTIVKRLEKRLEKKINKKAAKRNAPPSFICRQISIRSRRNHCRSHNHRSRFRNRHSHFRNRRSHSRI